MQNKLTLFTIIRSILFWIAAILFLPVCPLLAIVIAPLPRVPRFKMIALCAYVYTFLLKIICGVKYRVKGLDNIPKGSNIYAGNHQSAWETMALPCILPAFVWVMKKEVLNVPLFGWAVRAASAIPIDRSKGKDSMAQIIEKGKERTDIGFGITIFPEGTRSRPKQRKEFKVGAARLALSLDKPIVPFAHNSGYYLKKGGFWIFPGIVDVVIGKPIYPEDTDPQKYTKKLESWVYSELDKMGS